MHGNLVISFHVTSLLMVRKPPEQLHLLQLFSSNYQIFTEPLLCVEYTTKHVRNANKCHAYSCSPARELILERWFSSVRKENSPRNLKWKKPYNAVTPPLPKEMPLPQYFQWCHLPQLTPASKETHHLPRFPVEFWVTLILKILP